MADINAWIVKWAESGKYIKVSVENDGSVIIVNNKSVTFYFRFNLFDLYSDKQNTVDGILIEACDKRKHAPSAMLAFETVNKSVGFIRIKCNTPQQELDTIRNAFLQLKRLSLKKDVSILRPKDAEYFGPAMLFPKQKRNYL